MWTESRTPWCSGSPGGAALPEGIDIRASLPDEPWRAEGEDHVVTRIRVDAKEGPRIAEEVGSDKVETRGDDGSVVIGLRVAGFPAVRSWILGLLDHAEILEPPEFRAELVAWLTAIATGAGPPDGLNVPDLLATHPGSGNGGAGPRPVPGRETSQRLRRLLAVVGWLAQVGEAPIADVARRFGMDEDELIRELELAACCGVPPYTPDTLMEIEVSETSVRAFLPPEFARPAPPDAG